ncbi:MAG TPA: GNAT family N-acetyltransferase [Candidatus Acidoferrales bacterium]|nr:GNAT family N-acetyltransferase [Candidatus Acidoferrales bacterium]
MDIKIRRLEQSDLPHADLVRRLAFGTFLGVPEPEKFGEDTDHIKARWLADPNAAFAAEIDGKLVGTNLATRWGTFGFFGPLTVHPDFWDRGVAKSLLNPTIRLFDEWKIRHAALFTFAHSPKHLGLYQKFGFWPRFLTPLMSKTAKSNGVEGWTKFSEVPNVEKEHILESCRSVTGSVYEGLDVEREITSVQKQQLGDTVLLWDGKSMVGFAVCHCGAGTEAGTDVCYVKFAAIRKNRGAGSNFERLLDACDALAAERGISSVLAGVNTACHDAYRRMLARGYRTEFQGVLMLNPNEPAFDYPENYVLCDLR